MSPGGPKVEGGTGADIGPENFVEPGTGDILVGKLASTLLGAVWLTAVAGWITIIQAITRIHVRILDAAATMFVRVIEAAGFGGAEVIRASWGEAFRAAVEVNPLLAPTILTVEVLLVSGILLWARRRLV